MDLLDHAEPTPQRSPLKLVKLAAGVVAIAVLGYLVWQWASDMAGIKREAPKMAAIIPLPPPPPPPPEPEKPPEPEEPKEEEVVEPEPEPEPTPAEEPKPEEAPKPMDDLSQAMEMNADAQAGTDAFNIRQGTGGGMAGSGAGRVGNATYSQYLGYALQKILRENEETRNLAWRQMRINVWLTAAGQVTQVEVTTSSGDADVDTKVVAALRAAGSLSERPPASFNMPVRVALSSRRPT